MGQGLADDPRQGRLRAVGDELDGVQESFAARRQALALLVVGEFLPVEVARGGLCY